MSVDTLSVIMTTIGSIFAASSFLWFKLSKIDSHLARLDERSTSFHERLTNLERQR
jgi:hypothetical protein